LLRTSFKKILVFFKANRMEHSVASAIRTVGEKICRRLDVLIAAAGQPPVQDIEGTNAPRKPLAPSVAAKNKDAAVQPPVEDIEGTNAPHKPIAASAAAKNTEALLSQPPVTATPAHATPTTPVPRKRGRPPKVQSAQVSEAATPQNDTPEDTCEVSIFFNLCFIRLTTA
jgi:hypothetical protein